MRADELYKFSNGTLKSVRDEIHHRVLDFHLDYNKEMPKRKLKAVDRRRSSLMIELIDKQLGEREISRNLEWLVGAREIEMDYKLMTDTGSIHMLSATPKLLSGIEDGHHGPSDAMHNPSHPHKVSQQNLVSFLTEITRISIDFLTPS
ncbi:hypothetical protein Tco_0260006 [Tanacetum coccineum]